MELKRNTNIKMVFINTTACLLVTKRIIKDNFSVFYYKIIKNIK